MGSSFISESFYTTASAKEVFGELYDRDLSEHGYDAYSGTFATTYFVGEQHKTPEYEVDIDLDGDGRLYEPLHKGEATAYPILAVDDKKRKKITKKIVVKNGEEFRTVSRNSLKLKENERINNIRILSQEETSSVAAVAVKEKVVTKYFIIGKHLANTLDDWSTGFDTQAAARARATEFMKSQDTKSRYSTKHNMVEIVGLSRRESGAGLVEITRTVKKTDYEIEIIVDTVILGKRGGWLIYGIGSC